MVRLMLQFSNCIQIWRSLLIMQTLEAKHLLPAYTEINTHTQIPLQTTMAAGLAVNTYLNGRSWRARPELLFELLLFDLRWFLKKSTWIDWMRTVLMVVYYNYPVEKMNNIIGKMNGKINAAILQHSAPILFIHLYCVYSCVVLTQFSVVYAKYQCHTYGEICVQCKWLHDWLSRHPFDAASSINVEYSEITESQ